jgi:ParB family transcriptional regulator, chromosome partitioning protein
VKPARDAHHRLVALIRAQQLLQPLVVRPADGKPKFFQIIAGDRRLMALKEIHRGDGDPKIPCILRDVDIATADAMSLGENFGREPMHPLDEAEAFARLASGDGKDAKAISAEFGVKEHYVRQRMKLATLAEPIKVAYRENRIDTGMAEAFAAVPEDRQLEVWKEVGGNPRHADHVRNVIANSWIDAMLAVFDRSILPDSAVSSDLFNERVLIERQAFMEAQSQALDSQRTAMTEDGWSEVVVGRREDIQDWLYAMDTPERQFDKPTERKLTKIATRHEKLEAMAEKCADDPEKLERLQKRIEELETEEQEIIEQAPELFSEETKSVSCAFLILDPDGRVHREYRIPRRRNQSSDGGSGDDGVNSTPGEPKPPTSDELSDKQLAVTFTHQGLAVREALLKNDSARKRVLVMIQHDKIRSEALSVIHQPNGTTLHASRGDGFSSLAYDRLGKARAKLDPFAEKHPVEDQAGYEQLRKLSKSKLDSLIDLLVVDCVTAHTQRPTEFVQHLAKELKVNIRDYWRPDTTWLSSFQKIQLAHLITDLQGSAYAPTPDRKKSELVETLATLFAEAADGKLADKELEERVNRWLPSNMKESTEEQEKESV